MLFGLCNIPALFQSYIDRAVNGLEDELIVYLDNILIFRSLLEELHICIQKCLQCLRKNKLFAKLKKCQFEVTKTRLLGFIINNKGIAIEPKRVATIQNQPKPKILTQTQEFIGFVNFYRRFIFNLSEIIKPITDLTWKSIQVFKWNVISCLDYDQRYVFIE